MKRLLLQAPLFVAILVVLQAAVTALVPPETPFKVRVLNDYLHDGIDIIYFGDSSVRHVDPADHDRATMAEFLRRRMPGASIGDVLGSSYNLDLYAEYVKYIVGVGGKPKLVIVPINLRSFSPEWDRQPMYQFEQLKLYLSLARRPLGLMLYRPLSVFKDMQPIKDYEYLDTPVFDGRTMVGTVRDFDNDGYRDVTGDKVGRKMVFRYMYSLDPEHRKLRSLVTLANTLKANGIGALLYATPIDFETAEQHLGPRVRARVRQNMDVIRAALRDADADVLDMATAIPAKEFVRYNYPIEHLNQKGRRIVAEEIHRYITVRYAGLFTDDRRAGD